MKNHVPKRLNRGLTLLELLVVLTILVVLSTIALTTSSGMVNKTRDEATKKILADIREAVIGPSNVYDPDGTPVVTGILADIGRPPKSVSESVGGGNVFTLRELWENAHGVAAYEARAATAAHVDDAAQEDAEVILATGWRGPYLRVSTADGLVRDGWNSALVSPDGVLADYPHAFLKTLSNTPVSAAGQEIGQVESAGANPFGRPSETGYDLDLQAYTPDETTATLNVIVEIRNADGTLATPVGSDEIVVRLFGPDPSTGMIEVKHEEVDFTVSSFTHQFSTTPGIRAARAYYDANKDGIIESKSAIAHINLRAGGNTRLIVLTVP